MTVAGGHSIGAGPLLERDAPLATLDGVVARVCAGHSGAIVVEGAAGLGKSRLLAEAGQAAHAHGATVLKAAGRELERTLPWGLTRRLLAPAVWRAQAAGRSILSTATGAAAWMFDRSVAPNRRADGVLAIAYALGWVITSLADAGPLVLAIDDLHWADPASLQFLAFLLGRLDDLPVGVLAARRPHEPDAERRITESILADPGVEQLTLQPLSTDAVEVLVGDALGDRADDGLAPRCAALTRGNPFYLRELLLELAALPDAPLRAAALDGITPRSVSRSVFLRLARLEPSAVAFARAVAVLGPGAAFSHATELAGLTEAEAVRAFDVLTAVEILQAGPPLSFVHPLVAQAVDGDIGPGARGALHRDAARLLDRDGAGPEALAAHLMRAGRHGDPWVVTTLRAAAAAALAHGATESAAAWLARALAEPPDPQQRADVLAELGRAEATLGRPEAIERLESAIALVDTDEPYARICADLGRALTLRGRPDAAAAAFDRGLARLDDPGSELAKELRAAWWSAASLHAALRPGANGAPDPPLPDIGARPTAGERELLAQVAMQRAFAGHGREQVAALAERAWDDGALLDAGAGDGLSWSLVSGALLVADDVERGLDVCAAALADARRRGSPMAYANACYCRAWPLFARGAISASIADAQAALDARRDGWSAFVGTGTAMLVLGLVERGDLAAAQAALALVRDDVALRSSTQYPMVLVAGARLLVAEGRPAAALDALLQAGELLAGAGMDCPSAVPWCADAALAAGLAGDRDRAATLAQAALESARRGGAPTAIARAQRAVARATRGADAIELHRQAVATLDGLPPRLERTHALVDLGAALRRARRRADARVPLREALGLAQAGGALALAERARVELAAAGARATKQPRDGVAALTPSERRVAEMAADGMTNRAVAEALFVTVKAVEYHLANTYRKLDISSRRQLAPLLAAANPAPRDGDA